MLQVVFNIVKMESSVFYSANPVERMKPPSKLSQSLFELCVLVGIDEDTKLIPMNRVTSQDSLPNYFHG